jgi:hypothetical protein
MRTHTGLLAMLACIGTSITAADDHQFPDNPSFTTVAITPLAIERLTGDEHGNLYATDRAAPPDRCPLWQIDPGGRCSTSARLATRHPAVIPPRSPTTVSCTDQPLTIPG